MKRSKKKKRKKKKSEMKLRFNSLFYWGDLVFYIRTYFHAHKFKKKNPLRKCLVIGLTLGILLKMRSYAM